MGRVGCGLLGSIAAIAACSIPMIRVVVRARAVIFLVFRILIGDVSLMSPYIVNETSGWISDSWRLVCGPLGVVPEESVVFGGAGVPMGAIGGGCWAGCVQNGGD